jgi:hypothetical protein
MRKSWKMFWSSVTGVFTIVDNIVSIGVSETENLLTESKRTEEQLDNA